MSNRIVLIHGYSDNFKGFEQWKNILLKYGYKSDRVHVCNYKTLTNEVTIRDLAEGLDRALRVDVGLNEDEKFDAIVHSTGMLVIRSWLAAYSSRRERLKHLIALAPATFGSPLAHKGRSWLGALFKGKKEFGPDFLEAGDRVLDALELGSRFTWDLAHTDLIGNSTKDGGFYGRTKTTPYVFVFCGTSGYSGLRRLVNPPGTDGTVRLAGCALNTRKIEMDLTVEPGDTTTNGVSDRVKIAPWTSLDIPLIPIDGLNHKTIISSPSDQLISIVLKALKVDSAPKFDEWLAETQKTTSSAKEKTPPWQQFIVKVVDERGDPVTDYHMEVIRGFKGSEDFCEVDVHTYSGDASLRCFHVDLSSIDLKNTKFLKIRLIASSGSSLVQYFGFGSERINLNTQQVVSDGKWDAEIDISKMLLDNTINFFYSFTTTLIELKINREPQPLIGRTNLVRFL